MDNSINTQQYQTRAANTADADAVAAVINASLKADIGEEWLTADELLIDWSAPEFDLEHFTVLAHDEDGQPVGWAALYDRVPHVMKWLDVAVLPAHRDGPLPGLLVDALEARAHARVSLAPETARVRAMLGAFEGSGWIAALAQARGYEPMRTFYEMRIDLEGVSVPEPQWAEGIRIADATEIPIPQTYRVIYDSFKDHFGSSSDRPFEVALESWSHHVTGYPTYQPEYIFTAMDGDKAVGVSACVPGVTGDMEMGYVMTLGVLASHRRMGIALALLHHSFRAFQEAGLRRGGLDVDGSSITNATQLYKKAGMHIHRREQSYALILREGEESINTNTGEGNDA